MDYTIILTSSVVATLVSSVILIRNNDRKIASENITQERAKWRESIRNINTKIQLAFLAQKAEDISVLGSELKLLFNPTDKLDHDILKEIDILCEGDWNRLDLTRFSVRLSLLLKHDWERAKRESRPFKFLTKEIKRLTYSQYIEKVSKF